MKARQDDTILFLGKQSDIYCDQALELCERSFSRVTSCIGNPYGEPLPEKALEWKGDYIISYLGRWILPEEVLSKASNGAINFHPAPPEYPGVGCVNFALYDEVGEYGVTCHHMAPEVDTGEIIEVKRFDVFEYDNVQSIIDKAYFFQKMLFQKVINYILYNKRLPPASTNENWTKKPTSKKSMESLYKVNPNVSKLELERIIRATSFHEWQPHINLHGYKFSLDFQQ